MKSKDVIQEKLFQSHIESEKIKTSRAMCLLGSMLYVIFGIVDLFSLSATLTEVLYIRGGVILVVLGCFWTTYQSFFIKYYNLILSVAYLLPAFGIEAMIYLALPEDHAANVYFAGLILVIMVLFAWSYFKLATSLIVTSIIIGTYFYVESIKGMDVTETLVNMFFLVSAGCIGFVSQLIRDGFVTKNFLLQQSLHDAFKAKAEEAKDNEYLANHDGLTGLPNRRYMTELLENSMKEAEEKDKVLVIMFLDLNGFKQVNDIYGHAAGDKVLKVVAKRLELAIRSGDHIARLGGDEYLIGLMMHKDHLGEAENMTEKFAAIIAQPMNIEGVRVRVGSSIGLSAYPIHGNQISVLMEIADKRMYAAKKGRPSASIASLYEEKDNKIAVFPGKKV